MEKLTNLLLLGAGATMWGLSFFLSFDEQMALSIVFGFIGGLCVGIGGWGFLRRG